MLKGAPKWTLCPDSSRLRELVLMAPVQPHSRPPQRLSRVLRHAPALLISHILACSGASSDADLTHSLGANTSEPYTNATDGGESPKSPTEGTLDLGASPAPCDVWTQDCTGGTKCTYRQIQGEYESLCVPIRPASQPLGSPCNIQGSTFSGLDNCDRGAMCRFLDEQGDGLCMAFCQGSASDPQCSTEDSFCELCPDCPSFCIPLCDPLNNDCPLDLSCGNFDQKFGCAAPLDPNQSGVFGEECEFSNQCASGLTCVSPEDLPGCAGIGCCTPYCDLRLDSPCPGATICAPYFLDVCVLQRYEKLGICLAG